MQNKEYAFPTRMDVCTIATIWNKLNVWECLDIYKHDNGFAYFQIFMFLIFRYCLKLQLFEKGKNTCVKKKYFLFIMKEKNWDSCLLTRSMYVVVK